MRAETDGRAPMCAPDPPTARRPKPSPDAPRIYDEPMWVQYGILAAFMTLCAWLIRKAANDCGGER